MILVGNQRGNAKDLALHLMKQENERVEVHEIRGFCSDTLMGAFNESYAMSRATKCKQHLFSLSLNPPKETEVSNKDFESAIGQVEEKLGLIGQPRAIVFHEKEGRRHCHAVWSRIDSEEMRAVQLSYSKNKLKELSRELYIEHGWKMPRGLVNSEERDPRNFTLAEWQQAKRIGKDARDVKTQFQDAWAISDSKAAFTHALQERGYKLARGDRRGFVAIDHNGEVYSLSKWCDIKPKQIKERLGDAKALPSVAVSKAEFAQEMLQKMQNFQQKVERESQEKARKTEEQHKTLETQQQAKAEALAQTIQQRQQREETERQARIRHGLWGLVDYIIGKRKKTLEQNEQERQQAATRDRQQKDDLLAKQQADRERFIENRKQVQQRLEQEKQELQGDTKRFEEIRAQSEEERRKQEFMEQRKATTRDNARAPSMER
ncbi:MAG: hypothetical protein R3D71_08395 [Rickettsiales bacterium]